MGVNCRFCGTALEQEFANLGMSPLSNAFLRQDQLHRSETFYPLTAYVCCSCMLVQLPAVESPDNIFSQYLYFSSYSESWLAHARAYCEEMIDRFGLSSSSKVVEVASNDGYLLRNFVQAGIPVLGIEPAKNVAEEARRNGVDTLVKFFGVDTATELARGGVRADLLVGNNVLAHVPDINDFVGGLKILLGSSGVITMEFPHLLRLMLGRQFDTIYHEHFSYFSLMVVLNIFSRHGLLVFDVEELATHGGSLRIYACHVGSGVTVRERVGQLLLREKEYGLGMLATYRVFANQVHEAKRSLLSFLIRAKEQGKKIAGYGAPAKGNTLLNYCGIGTDIIDYTVDRSPHKQGLYLPGTRIPIFDTDHLLNTRPDYVLVLPWNLKDEIVEQMSAVRNWGGRFVVAIPEVMVIP